MAKQAQTFTVLVLYNAAGVISASWGVTVIYSGENDQEKLKFNFLFYPHLYKILPVFFGATALLPYWRKNVPGFAGKEIIFKGSSI